MFANFLNLFSRRHPPEAYETEFVREVAVGGRPPRRRAVERLIWICWVLIALKCAAVVWCVRHYRIPFNPLWVVAPTLAFAALCTGVYYLRRK